MKNHRYMDARRKLIYTQSQLVVWFLNYTLAPKMGFEWVELSKMENWNVRLMATLILLVWTNRVLMESLISLGNWNVLVMAMSKMLDFPLEYEMV